MGVFSEYLKAMPDRNVDELRQEQMRRIEALRESRVISYAARISQLPVNVDIGISYDDMLPFTDLLRGLSGERVTVILETPGGGGEVGRRIVEMLHDQFKWVEFLVPGMAMSTGTIMCLGGHEILMGPASSLGPIDAQMQQDGKRFSADALIEGFEAIKKEVDAKGGQLNSAYIPVLQRISPGELQGARNALEFARATVADWLERYKFRDWEKDGVPVAREIKQTRAREIADALSRQSVWHTHGRSLGIADLVKLGLKITDFSAEPDLYDAVQRYQVLTRITFESSDVYKMYETATATIAKRFHVPVNAISDVVQKVQVVNTVQVGARCGKCNTDRLLQLDFTPDQPLAAGRERFPNEAQLPCSGCGAPIDYAKMRSEIEKQIGRTALTPQPTS